MEGFEPVRVHIRWMIRRDMPEVLAIENVSHDYPWCEEEFLRVLRVRNCIGMSAELGGRVVGFMIYELHQNKLNVLDFAVHPDYRRRSVGQQMVDSLVRKLSDSRRTKIVLKVRETNLLAQLFFRAQGFRTGKVVRGYYDDSGEDAFKMRFLLSEGEYKDENKEE